MADASDYYAVLEVSPQADADEIRKAYRRLARQCHPDVNGGDPEATERFKQLNRAYETLSNPEKRARYDRFGPEAANGNGGGGADFGAGFNGFGDLFDIFFGGAAGGASRGPAAGNDLRADVTLTLNEVLSGAQKSVTVNRLEHCPDCEGRGAKAGTQPQRCIVCAGQGFVQTTRTMMGMNLRQQQECYRCHGRGEIITDPCARCRGKGTERQARKVQVSIPAGIETGQRMRMSGEGDAGPFGGPSGDLYLFFEVRRDPAFRVQGKDLISEVDLSFARAALGGTIEIKTLEGQEQLKVPAGAQPGDVFRLRGKGLPELNRPQSRGDQHVILRVAVPKHLNDRQRKALQEFAEASGENLAEVDAGGSGGGVFEWVRNLFHRDESTER